MRAYYNEWDKNAAAWLRQLIKDGLITDGEVDERSITEVEAADLVGFNRVHFFAGIGTWDYCLNEAGWGDRPVFTASLPCQPFSVAGKGLGKSDERHLLPHFIELVRQCKPDTCFGEQTSSAIRHGWLDDLHAEMGREGYSVGHCVFGAHSTGGAHIRQRLYWVAHNLSERLQKQPGIGRVSSKTNGDDEGQNFTGSGGMGDTSFKSSERITRSISEKKDEISRERLINGGISYGYSDAGEIDWLYCRDNKYRPVKSGTSPLVNATAEGVVYSGDPSQAINADYSTEARAMRLKGYGNAIVAGCGIEFISAFMDVSL